MISEKVQHIATIPAVLLGGVMLGLVVDSRIILYTLLTMTLVVALACVWFIVRKPEIVNHRSPLHIAVTFFSWTAFASLFAARAFQIVSIPVLLIIGLALAVISGFLWTWPQAAYEQRTTLAHLLSLLTFQWFVIFLFAPANYMVLGALMAVVFTSTALLFEFHNDSSITRRDVVVHIIVTLLVSSIFILGFKWVL